VAKVIWQKGCIVTARGW